MTLINLILLVLISLEIISIGYAFWLLIWEDIHKEDGVKTRW